MALSENDILILCSDAALRETISRRIGAASGSDSRGGEGEGTVGRTVVCPLDAVVELAHGRYRAVVCTAGDIAGREAGFFAAVREVAPDVGLLVVCRPEEEPMARQWVGLGAEDYFVGPFELPRLAERLKGGPREKPVKKVLVTGKAGPAVSPSRKTPSTPEPTTEAIDLEEAPGEDDALFAAPEKVAEAAEPARAAAVPSSVGAGKDVLGAAVAIGLLANERPADILKKGAEIVLNAVGAARGSLLSWDADARDLSLEVAHGVPEELVAEMASGEHAIARMAARSGEPVLVGIEDVVPSVEQQHPERYRTGSFLCMPMLASVPGGKSAAVGVICVTSKLADEPLSTDDQAVLEPLANELAQVYSSARRREQFRGLAHTDDETGLANQRFFFIYLTQLIEQARDEIGEVGLLLLSADSTTVNGVSIRPRAQELLQIGKAVATISGAGVRVARLRENLFAVTLWRAVDSPLEKEDPYAALTSQIQALVAEHDLPATISIGYSIFPTYADSDAQLVQQATSALRRTTVRGPNSVVGPQ